MFDRLIKLLKTNSFFLFGARGTGKTTLLKQRFSEGEAHFINLLDPGVVSELQAYPQRLNEMAMPAVNDGRWVLIDEVQKVPELLDVVHHLIESKGAKFGLTGSSARKLRRGASNLLAGRAFTYRLFSLLPTELRERFDTQEALTWGTLPKIFDYEDHLSRSQYLQSYVETYLQEEIVAEQVIRKIPPFRRFLDVAAQANGEVINYARIARDIHTDPVTTKSYFEILDDTLLGFFLEPFHTSVRKRQRQAPKFYLFDCGVIRALGRQLDVSLQASTFSYGRLFETFMVNAIRARLEYSMRQYRLSYLLTKDQSEIDLIVERGGTPTLCIEIKSSKQVRAEQLRSLKSLSNDIPGSIPLCLFDGLEPLIVDGIDVLPWRGALEQYF